MGWLKKIIWSETILTILIVLFLSTLFVIHRLTIDPYPYINTSQQRVLKSLKTGDLLLLRYESKYGYLVKTFRNSWMTHCGLVLVRDEQINVIEVVDYRRFDDRAKHLFGLCVVPIQRWIELNDGRLCGWSQYIGNEISTKQVEKILQRNEKIRLDMNILRWFTASIRKKESIRKYKKNYFCSEFIAAVLQELQLLDATIDPSWYSPDRLAQNKNYRSSKYFYLDY